MSVAGHPLSMFFNGNSGPRGYLSVLARDDSGNSILSVLALDLFTDELHLLAELELDGVPVDVVSPGDGEYYWGSSYGPAIQDHIPADPLHFAFLSPGY